MDHGEPEAGHKPLNCQSGSVGFEIRCCCLLCMVMVRDSLRLAISRAEASPLAFVFEHTYWFGELVAKSAARDDESWIRSAVSKRAARLLHNSNQSIGPHQYVRPENTGQFVAGYQSSMVLQHDADEV